MTSRITVHAEHRGSDVEVKLHPHGQPERSTTVKVPSGTDQDFYIYDGQDLTAHEKPQEPVQQEQSSADTD